MKRRTLAIAAVTVGLAGSAFAQAKPEDEIRYRQSVMNVVGRAFMPMVQMAQDKIPYNRELVARNTRVMETLIGLHWDSFGPGTEKGAPTKADMKIWSEPDKFEAAADKAVKAVATLGETVKGGGDEKAVKAALGEVGKTCKGCHDDYRLKEARN